jgi:signal peptidase I
LVEAIIIVAAAFLLAFLVQQFIVKPYTIPSPSMEPTLETGDRVLVVFRPPGQDGAEPFIKRVVAVAGDKVSVHDGILYLNGAAQGEPYVKESPMRGELGEVTVSPECVYVMGDNRNDSSDSRVFGEVSQERIVGVAFAIYWPPRHVGGL